MAVYPINVWSTRVRTASVQPFACTACGHQTSALVESAGVASMQLPGGAQAPSGLAMRDQALSDAGRRALALVQLAPCPRCHRRARGPAVRLWFGRLAAVGTCLAGAALLGYMLVMLIRDRGSLVAAVCCLVGIALLALFAWVALRTARGRWRASRELVTFPDDAPASTDPTGAR